MTKTNNSARLAFASRLAFTLMSAALVACSQDQRGEERGVRIQAMPTESSFPLFDSDGDRDAHSSQRLLLDFDSSPLYSSASYSFFRLGDYLSYSYATDQGRRKVGSVRVSNRTAAWQGPVLTMPSSPRTSYTASFWVKLINTKRTANAKLVLVQVSGTGTEATPLVEVEILPGGWQKVEGKVAAGRYEGGLHALRLEVEGADIDYLVDDILVEEAGSISEFDSAPEPEAFEQAASAPTTAIVLNGDVERGLEPWTYQGGEISRSKQQAYSGEYSLLITDRTEPWHAPAMMLNGLEDNQLYRFSIFVRLTEEFAAAPVQLTLKQVVDGEPMFLPIANTTVSNGGWTEVSGNLSLPDFSKSQEVSLYLESVDPLASYYVDNLTIEPQ